MSIKVLVNGAKGKMGSETLKAVRADNDLELVGQTDIGDDLSSEIKKTKADVVVDFTQPDHVMRNIERIIENGAHAVIGTTGIKENQLSIIEKLCKEYKVNCLIAPNFAIGAILMMKFSQEAAKYMPSVEIIELHHDKKLDKPSGTAIKTAQMMSNLKNIPIHSVRLPGFVAHQEVIFGGLGQTLTIRHDTINRESFMPGVILAIKKIQNLPGLTYGLEKII